MGGVSITQYPSSSGTSISFKAIFIDVNATQSFKISYEGSSQPYELNYKKIKSLFYGTCTGGGTC